MTVYFIGAGPGDPGLLTVRGRSLIEACEVCLYAGSLVPAAVVGHAPAKVEAHDTSALHLDQILGLMRRAHASGKNVARVQSGDPSLYGSIAEQIRRLRHHGINYEIVPGVPAFAAAAAALGQELTLPEVAQTVILTRTGMKSTAMPDSEDLAVLGKSGATLAIHLSVRNALEIQRKLIPLYGPDCPAAIAYRIGWPDQSVVRTELGKLRETIRKRKFTRTALILVGPALGEAEFPDSSLYDASHPHVLRTRAERRRSDANSPSRKSGARTSR